MENRRIADVAGAVVLFFILLFVYTKFAGPIPFSVNNINTNQTDLFQTQGIGKAAAVPDIAVINLGITKSASDVLSAQKQTNQIANNIIKGLRNQDISEKKIKTTNYSVSPEYSITGTSQKIIGYIATQNLEVEIPIDKTSEAIDSATANGANLIGNISFKLNDEKREEVENSARKEAVGKAKKSAEGLAKASGIKLGKIINVTESSASEPRPVFLEAAKTAEEDSRPSTNITPGETNVEIRVILTYQTF